MKDQGLDVAHILRQLSIETLSGRQIHRSLVGMDVPKCVVKAVLKGLAYDELVDTFNPNECLPEHMLQDDCWADGDWLYCLNENVGVAVRKWLQMEVPDGRTT